MILLLFWLIHIPCSVLLVIPTEVTHKFVIIHLFNHLELGAGLATIHLIELVLSRDNLIDILYNATIFTRMSGQPAGVRGSIVYFADLLLLLVLLTVAIRYLEYVFECLRGSVIVFLTALAPPLLCIGSSLHAIDILNPLVVGSSLWGVHRASLTEGLHSIEEADAGLLIQFETCS